MKRRLLALLLCCACVVGIFAACPIASAAEIPGMSAFEVGEVPPTTMTDVKPGAWYYDAVCYTQAAGIVSGSNGKYLPNNKISYAECITMAVRIYESYYGITPTDTVAGSGEAWYQPFVRRAESYGILPETSLKYTASATRELLVALFCNTLPQEEYPARFHYAALPDVTASNKYYAAILSFYNAGIVVGSDTSGTFYPSSTTTRAEVAVIVYKMLQPEKRRINETPEKLEAFDIDLNNLSCTFSDVPQSAWYYQSVAAQQQLGLLNGVGNNRFAPNDTVTVAQTLAVATRIYEQYYGTSVSAQGANWMEQAKNKAIAYGLITASQYSTKDLSRKATRQETIGVLYHALDEKEYFAMNTITTLPDMNENDVFFSEILSMYQAGVISGSDSFGTFLPATSITRAELAAILTRMVVPSMRINFFTLPAEKITYGYSGEYEATKGASGYPLEAYRIGNGKNVLLLTYCIHGTESANTNNSNIHGDGIILNRLAYQMIDYLKQNYSTVKAKNWSVYIIPACNPDGLNYPNGKSSGVGRQTKYYYNNTKTALICDPSLRHGIDMNRSFDYGFSANTTVGSYYYCGVTPRQCVESEYLAAFAKSIKGTGKNVAIDTHGWYSQILVGSSTTGTICQAFYKQFGFRNTSTLKGSGYFASYCKQILGYQDACLFEMPSSVECDVNNGWKPYATIAEMQAAFDKLNCKGKYQAAILEILKKF